MCIRDRLAILPLALSAWCALRACDLTSALPVGGSDVDSRSIGRVRATTRVAPQVCWFLLSGVAAGIAIWFKYSFALIAFAIVSVPLVVSIKTSGLWPGLAWGMGVLAIAALGVAFLGWTGILPATIESARVASEYAAQNYAGGHWLSSPVWTAGVNERITRWWPLLGLAGLWWPLRARLIVPAAARPASGVMWLWLLAALVNVLVQAKGFDYHWLPGLPPLLIIAFDTILTVIEAVLPSIRAMRIGVTAVAAALLGMLVGAVTVPALPILLGHETRADYAAHFSAGEFSAAESTHMADFLRARVAPGDTLFIWGSRPEVYFESQLRPATRFVSHTILSATWTDPTWRKENVDVLWAAMPPYTLVLQGDYFPWVTGNNDDSATLLQGYTELNNWLMANYERDGQIGNFLIWKRKKT